MKQWLIYAQCPMGRSTLEPEWHASKRWMTSYVSCICLSALPPPPQPNKRISCKSRKCSSVLERVLEHVSLRSPGYTKKTPTIFSGIQHTISDGLCQCYSSLLDFFFLSNYELLGRCIGWFGSPFTGSWDLEHHKKELRVKMMGIHLCFKATYCKPCMKHSWF